MVEELKERMGISDLTIDTKKNVDVSVNKWEELRVLVPQPSRRSYHSAVVWQSSMIIVGGQDLREGPQGGVWRLSLEDEKEEWEELKVAEVGPLYRGAAAVHNNDLYLFGGTNGDSEFNTLQVLSLTSLTWRNLEVLNSPPPLDSHTMCLYEHFLLVFGGYVSGAKTNNLYIFNIQSKSWELVDTPIKPPERSNHSAVVHSHFMYVFGGSDDEGSRLADVWKFDIINKTWHEEQTTGHQIAPRSGHSAVVFGELMVVFGGMKDITKETNEMLSYDFRTRYWTLFQGSQAIRDPVSAEMLEEYKKSKSPTKTGGKSPKKDDSPESPNKKKKKLTNLYDGPPATVVGRVKGNVPHPRDGHSAVLIRNTMVVFGGDRHQMPFNDTYFYTLSKDTIKTPL